MSEYWMFCKRYYCKYCANYITNNAPSHQQHENGLGHKGNRERFIRRGGREMASVEQAAQIAFAQDVGTGHAKLRPNCFHFCTGSQTPPKPSNPFTNYSTAKTLGYDDPDAERLTAEVQQRRMQGVAGEWEMVAPSSEPAPQSPNDADAKRSAEALEAAESQDFKPRKRTMAAGLGQIYDPGVIAIKLKTKKEPLELVSLASPTASSTTYWGPRELRLSSAEVVQ
ncbi:hypothetical protein DFH08DRAFT_909569 [Mycena albidolilacea]|uniref:Matrin-type domain-containing protein n=1 Tax=Mycena albidolilacea TaxID=1033008 RepID=A0AAD7F4W5_9AGAR|nr:hypothetical protein DFH08DRAFT_909569 [Mycena albidolilacea]